MRGDNDYPVTIAAQLPERRHVRLLAARWRRASRRSSGRTRARGRVPLDRSAAEYTPEIGNIDRGYVQTWNVAFERRLPFDTSVDVAYVGAKGDRRLRRARHQRAARCSAPATRAVRSRRPRAASSRSTRGAQRLKTDYQSLQIALNKPFTHGLLFKGAYTLSKSMNESDNDGRATLTWNTPSELYRNWAPAGLRPPAQLPDGLRVFAAVAEQRPATTTSCKADRQRLADQRRVRGVQRHAVHGDRERHVAEHAEQPRRPPTSSARSTSTRQHRRGRRVVRHGGVRAADRRAVRQHEPQPVLRSRRLQPGLLGLPRVPVRRHAATRGPGRRPATSSTTRVYDNPQGNITSGTFGQITGVQRELSGAADPPRAPLQF